MKKAVALCLGMLLVFSLCSCAGESDSAVIDYGESNIYSTADMDEAIAVVTRTFAGFDGCVLHSLAYAGDEVCLDNLDYCNSLDEDKSFSECIVFNSSFHSPKNGGGAWEADQEYTWTWYLARESAGKWSLLTYGYC